MGRRVNLIALDTNVIFLTLNTAESNHAAAVALMGSQGLGATMMIAPLVYTELCASPRSQVINDWLKESQISVEWQMPPEVWQRAGQAYREYADLRQNRQLPRRIAADFLIAAHAEYHQASIMTFDDTVYAAVFPAVERIGH